MFVVQVTGPEGDSRRVQIDGAEATIGRHTTSDVQLPRVEVSRHHARIVRRDDTITVADLKSMNGTYVNGLRIMSPFAVVHEHDEISIGEYQLVIHAHGLKPAAGRPRPRPPYLARDPIEQRLLTEIAARNEAARGVYADWLEERGDLERAEFLRIQQQVVRSPDEPGLAQLTGRLRALAATLDLPWRMRVARPPVERCPVAFERQCPKEWGQLEPTDRDGVRYCGACQKAVHYAPTIADARRHAQHGNCVAIDVAELRWSQDLEPPYGRFVCFRCQLDVGPGPPDCPRCGASLHRHMALGRMDAR